VLTDTEEYTNAFMIDYQWRRKAVKTAGHCECKAGQWLFIVCF